MKTVLKALLPVAIATATCASFAATPAPHSTYYKFTSVAGSTKVAVALQGVGAAKLPDPKSKNVIVSAIASVDETLELKTDGTFTGAISGAAVGGSPNDLFTLAGTWSYPAESKVIYFAIDGDISAGSAGDTSKTWGALFGGTVPVSFWMPLLIPKVSSVSVIYPSVSLKTGTIKLNSDGTASVNMQIIGKGIATDAAKGTTKEVGFTFGVTNKSTVSTTPPV